MLLFRFGFLTLLLLLASPLQARSGRQNQFPHGNAIQCDACHTEPNRGITDFGFDAYAAAADGTIDWPTLAAMDSDKDGYTNGVELGDPNGTWRQGNAQPGGAFWNPGDKDDNPCGNNTLEPGEDCDGGVDNTVTCQSLGLGVGSVRCSNLCKFETSFCVVCGDGRINPNLEECEGTDFENQSCQSLGFSEGNLVCDADCKIDSSDCSGVPDNCGDGTIQSPETCDGNQLDGKTCALLGYDGGTLSCTQTCRHDTSQCFGDPPTTPSDDMGTPNTTSDGGTNSEAPNEIIGEGTCSTASNSNSFLISIIVFILALRSRKRIKSVEGKRLLRKPTY